MSKHSLPSFLLPALLLLLLAGCFQARPEHRLRVVNKSSIAIQHLVVRFPQDQVDFGSVAAGEMSEYHPIPNGVYRYAAYDVDVNGKRYQQPVVDWVGENPLEGNDFTYTLMVDPAQWETHGRVIVLIQVDRDDK